LEVLTSARTGTVYVDLIREGQTVSTQALRVEDGRAETAVDLTQELHGTLEIHAYKILSSGHIVRDTRLALVDAPTDLSLIIAPDRETYLPGDDATVGFEVQGQDGAGVSAVLGIAVVDESVFALQEQDPGFAKLYFMLEKELMEPKYDIHGFSLTGFLQTPPTQREVRQAQETAAKATMAGAAGSANGFALDVNSHDDNLRQATEQREGYFKTIGPFIYAALIIAVALIVALALRGLIRQRVTQQALVGGLGLLLAAVGLLFLALSQSAEWLESAGAGLTGLLAVTGLVATLLAAWHGRDWRLGLQFGLLLLIALLLPLLIQAVDYDGLELS
jgi:hypothetical protein